MITDRPGEEISSSLIMESMSLFVGSEALALTLVMLTMKQDSVSWRFRLSGSKNRNVTTTIVWQICTVGETLVSRLDII